jgi:hypothetical protein
MSERLKRVEWKEASTTTATTAAAAAAQRKKENIKIYRSMREGIRNKEI